MKPIALLIALIFSLASQSHAGRAWEAVYVAPAAKGDGSGADAENAADFRDPKLWAQVQEGLEDGTKEALFVEGTYICVPGLVLSKLGREGGGRRLILRPQAAAKVTFRDDPADAVEKNCLIMLRNCQNITLSGFHFTGPERIGPTLGIDNCQDIVVERCTWTDLPGVYYSAISPVRSETRNITIRDCTFTRVGSGPHAHMIYNAYGPQRINVIDCKFEDCAGDFVRFRDETDYGVVWGCTFKSTGTFRGANPPMIMVPLFNDDNPASKPAEPNYEYFGTRFIFANNTFEYPKSAKNPPAMMFLHSGFDPPGKSHLLSNEESATLKTGSPEQRKALLLDQMGIDTSQVHIFNNTFTNVGPRLVYRQNAAYGAVARGKDEPIDIYDLVDQTPVANSVNDAVDFFQAKRK